MAKFQIYSCRSFSNHFSILKYRSKVDTKVKQHQDLFVDFIFKSLKKKIKSQFSAFENYNFVNIKVSLAKILTVCFLRKFEVE